MKRWSVKCFEKLKRWSVSRFIASLHRFIASSLSTLHKSMQKLVLNRAKHICEGKDDDVFQLCYGNYENNEFCWKLPMEFIASSLQCVNIFFVEALRQWRQIREAMKRWNVNYGKKLKQWSDEAFNAGKEIEAMKRLTLHRIASSLHRFTALMPSFAILYFRLFIFPWVDKHFRHINKIISSVFHLSLTWELALLITSQISSWCLPKYVL
jgi:hypothetical protein